MSTSVLDVLKRFDAYPKTLEDFRIKTFSGGTITLISAVVMILLFASETQDYLTPGTRGEKWDTTRRNWTPHSVHIVQELSTYIWIWNIIQVVFQSFLNNN